MENLIALARGIKLIGVKRRTFSTFGTIKIDEYAAQTKESWGSTPAYHELEEKSKGRGREQEMALAQALLGVIAEFHALKDRPVDNPQVREQVTKLQKFIGEHYYNCTNEIPLSLGAAYSGGGSMTENIDRVGDEVTAEYAERAIEAYCR